MTQQMEISGFLVMLPFCCGDDLVPLQNILVNVVVNMVPFCCVTHILVPLRAAALSLVTVTYRDPILTSALQAHVDNRVLDVQREKDLLEDRI